MTMIAWSDDYGVGIQEIDEQHKRLVTLINDLYTAVAQKQNHARLSKVLDELVEYTKIHFAVEECLMRLFDYKEYAAHKAIHDDIVDKVLTFQAKFRSGDDKVGMELLMFLKDWLINHIQKIDTQYSSHLTGQGVKKSWLRKFW